MSVSILVEHAQPAQLEFGVSPLGELVAALHALADSSHHHAYQDWAAQVRLTASAELLGECDELSLLWSSYRVRFLLPATAGLGVSFAEELDAVDNLSDETFAEHMAYGIRGVASGFPLVGVLSKPELQDEVRSRARAKGPAAERLTEQLFNGGIAVVRKRVRAVLDGCMTEFFAPMWTRLEPALTADAAARRDAVRREGIAEGLSALSPIARIADGPRRVILEKMYHGIVDLGARRLLVTPSAFLWPHILVKHELGWPALLQYPVAAPTSAAPAVPLHLAQRRMRILAAPTRVKICRAVAREALSTRELATRLGMTEPQVSRHLRTLREADLVTTTRNGHFVLYQLDVAAFSRVSADLLTALLR